MVELSYYFSARSENDTKLYSTDKMVENFIQQRATITNDSFIVSKFHKEVYFVLLNCVCLQMPLMGAVVALFRIIITIL